MSISLAAEWTTKLVGKTYVAEGQNPPEGVEVFINKKNF